jgi:hypothetical protein
MSPACQDRKGPWSFRADITQDGRNFDVFLYGGNFASTPDDYELSQFRGQDNPDGVLFFSQGGPWEEVLLKEAKAGAWSNGQARGQFQNGHIDAAFNGIGNGCSAADHSWVFVRR